MSAKRWMVLLAVLCLPACSKVDQAHYEQLELGQTYEQVSDILGSADECTDMLGGKKCTWGDDQRHIKATFAGDSLLFFSAKGLK